MVAVGFLPQNFGGGGTYESSLCLKMNSASVVWIIIGGVATQTLLAGKKIELSGGGNAKTLWFSLAS